MFWGALTYCESTDQCPTDPLKTEPGVCGCGVSDDDTDLDTVLDCNDSCPSEPTYTTTYGPCGAGANQCSIADADNDSTLDCNDGCPNDPTKTSPGACGCGTSDADTDGDGALDNCNATEPQDGGWRVVGVRAAVWLVCGCVVVCGGRVVWCVSCDHTP